MFRLSLIVFTICIHLITYTSSLRIELKGGIEKASQYAVNDLSMAYSLVDPDVDVETTIMSQEQILDQLADNKIDFGITSQSLPSITEEMHPTLRLVPLLVTGLAPIYNLKALGANSPPLVITREDLARIYLGQITTWAQLKHSNDLLPLPNTPITLVFEIGSNPIYKVMRRAFNKFLDIWASQPPTDDDSWPYSAYNNPIRVPAGATTLVSTVIARDGTLAISSAAIAKFLGANVARIKNRSGYEVSLSSDSLELAAIELGTSTESLSGRVTELTDATNPAAYPLTMFSYLIIDTTRVRATCKARQSLVTYLLHLYQSPVVAAMLQDRGAYAAVPSVVMERLGIKRFLMEDIRCRGQMALPTVVTNERFIGTSSSSLLKARLASTVYLSVNSSIKFTPQIAKDELLLTQIMSSELDTALINPAYIDANMWKEFRESDDFLVLPLYAHAITYFVNPLLRVDPYLSLSSSDTESITPEPFVLTMDLAVNMAVQCVREWNTARLIQFNPWIARIIKNETIYLNYISQCNGNMYSPTMVTFVATLATVHALNNPAQAASVLRCINPVTNPNHGALQRSFVKCEAEPGLNVQFVKDEGAAPAITLGTHAGITATIVDGDKSKLFASMAFPGPNGTRHVKADLDTIMNCAADTYNSNSMWFDLTSSKHPECWPFTQTTVLIVRKNYFSDPLVTNSSSCRRGNDALRFARWMVTTDDLDGVAASAYAGRLLQANPQVRRDYVIALEAALCDGNTLLITRPTIWDLSVGFEGFGVAASVIGMAWTLFSMAFVVVYHMHPVVRAASPWFVSTSLVGVMLMFASVIPLLMPATAETCSAVAWLFDLGIMISLAPLFAKAWRLNKIFGGRRLKVIKITNRRLMVMVLSMIVGELAILAAWQATSPLQPVTETVMEGTPPREHVYSQCSTVGDGDMFFITVALVKGALLVWGAILSFATRKVTSQFNESKAIALSIYNFLFTIGIIAAIFGVISPQGDVAIALLFLIAIWVSAFSSFMLIVPKMLVIWGTDAAATLTNTSVNTSEESAFSFLSVSMFSSLPMIGSYITALRRHLEAAENRQNMMKKSSGAAQMVSPQSTFRTAGGGGRQLDARSAGPSRIVSPTSVCEERKSP